MEKICPMNDVQNAHHQKEQISVMNDLLNNWLKTHELFVFIAHGLLQGIFFRNGYDITVVIWQDRDSFLSKGLQNSIRYLAIQVFEGEAQFRY